MKKIWIAVLALVMLLLLAGCGCEHEWEDANCETPKTCKLCDETEGAPLGHTWNAATCTEAKTCDVCNKTEGEAKGHSWEAATCLLPEKCSVCHETRGEALSHNWQEATTEAPKTCANCQLTEGGRLITDPRFTTASTKELHGKWYCDVTLTGKMLEMEGYIDKLNCTMHYEFGKTGELKASLEVHDMFAFQNALKKMTVDALYAEFAYSYGYDKTTANLAMQAAYGMTVEEYADTYVESVDMDEIFEEYGAFDGVYYVGQNGIYMALSWNNTFECSTYTLENGVLIIAEETLEEGGEPLQFKRVEDKT